MELLIARCAGLDVHQATVVATVRVPDEQGGRQSVTETFGTMTADLLALRDWLQAYSREANDLAQILFAVYVSVAITAATRAHTHLAAGANAPGSGGRTQRMLMRVAALVVLVPWSSFVLYAAWSSVIQSVRQLEGFPETYNPGYFLIRIALVALAWLVLVQAITDALRPRPAGSSG